MDFLDLVFIFIDDEFINEGVLLFIRMLCLLL